MGWLPGALSVSDGSAGQVDFGLIDCLLLLYAAKDACCSLLKLRPEKFRLREGNNEFQVALSENL
jgi:hypothetical protein